MFGAVHTLWSILVLVGWAQPLINFIVWLHMLSPTPTVEPFGWHRALLLIVVTALVGYVLGYIGAIVWNKMHATKAA